MPDTTPFVCGRRAALIAAGAVGVGTLAACSGGDSGSSATSSTSSSAASSSAATSSDSSAGGGTALAKTTDIPVGGGKVFADAGVIVTQPEAGTFKGFTNVCTHQGAKIDQVTDKVMECPLHHSEFSITDGSVVQGPATQPLPEKTLTVTGDEISVA